MNDHDYRTPTVEAVTRPVAYALATCPHCREPWVELHYGSGMPYVYCRQCEMQGPVNHQRSQADAVAAWNALPRAEVVTAADLLQSHVTTALDRAVRAIQATDLPDLARSLGLNVNVLPSGDARAGYIAGWLLGDGARIGAAIAYAHRVHAGHTGDWIAQQMSGLYGLLHLAHDARRLQASSGERQPSDSNKSPNPTPGGDRSGVENER